MSKLVPFFILCLFLALASAGCVYRHYLGMRGPSIHQHPDSHQDAREDAECLQCHRPGPNPLGPPTNHPHFKGCLKCHNS
jgi:hypothetical protein